jgi:hypothetical protein
MFRKPHYIFIPKTQLQIVNTNQKVLFWFLEHSKRDLTCGTTPLADDLPAISKYMLYACFKMRSAS